MRQASERRFFTMAETYDRMCQVLVPQYDFMQDEVLRIVPLDRESPARFVDLGAGSGILLEKVLTRWSGAVGYWVDYSPDFYEVAQRRLGRFDDRVEYVLSSLDADWESKVGGQVDAILSMSAIHHLTEHEKKNLYRRCWAMLRPGGWFFNIDEMQTMHGDAYLASMRFWIRHVEEAASGIDAQHRPFYEQWTEHFDNWKQRNVDNIDRPKVKGDDIHQDFTRQVQWLKEAGFSNADVFIKYHLWCAIGGRKPASGANPQLTMTGGPRSAT